MTNKKYLIIKSISAYTDENNKQGNTDLQIQNDHDEFLQIEIITDGEFKGLITLDKYEVDSLLSSIKDTSKKLKYPK